MASDDDSTGTVYGTNDNLTKFILVKKYTKTYKSRKIPRNIGT